MADIPVIYWGDYETLVESVYCSSMEMWSLILLRFSSCSALSQPPSQAPSLSEIPLWHWAQENRKQNGGYSCDATVRPAWKACTASLWRCGAWSCWDLAAAQHFLSPFPSPFFEWNSFMTMGSGRTENKMADFPGDILWNCETCVESVYCDNKVWLESVYCDYKAWAESVYCDCNTCVESVYCDCETCVESVYCDCKTCVESVYCDCKTCVESVYCDCKTCVESVYCDCKTCFESVYCDCNTCVESVYCDCKTCVESVYCDCETCVESVYCDCKTCVVERVLWL